MKKNKYKWLYIFLILLVVLLVVLLTYGGLCLYESCLDVKG